MSAFRTSTDELIRTRDIFSSHTKYFCLVHKKIFPCRRKKSPIHPRSHPFIDRKDAKNHPEKNVITRALGAVEQAVPDFFEVELSGGDYVLLCSDGLTNMVEDSVLKETVLHGAFSLKEKAEKLVKLANENGGRDNISLVLIHI